MTEVKQYTGSLKALLSKDLDLEMWSEVQDCISDEYDLNNLAVYFAYDRDRIVGYILGSLVYNECWRIAVDYRYRNQGIAKELISVSGFKKPYDVLDTDEARGFWTSTGYECKPSKILVTV